MAVFNNVIESRAQIVGSLPSCCSVVRRGEDRCLPLPGWLAVRGRLEPAGSETWHGASLSAKWHAIRRRLPERALYGPWCHVLSRRSQVWTPTHLLTYGSTTANSENPPLGMTISHKTILKSFHEPLVMHVNNHTTPQNKAWAVHSAWVQKSLAWGRRGDYILYIGA